MSKTYTIHCLSRALSQITHNSGTEGNESIVMREPVITEQGKRFVPCLSANAIRHKMIREPGARWLIDGCGLNGELSLPQLNFLMHGGNLTESNAHENTRRIADMQRIFPLLHLLGGSLPNQILTGNMDVWRGYLACEENRSYIATEYEQVCPESRLRSAEHWIGDYQYTRGDARKANIRTRREADLLKDEGDEKSNLMIMSGQCVNREAVFLHGFTLKHVGELEVGALFHSLQLWAESGGTIGGQASRGHGRLKMSVLNIDGVDFHECVEQYKTHACEHKEEALQWLTDAFSKPKKTAKKKAAKKKASN